jgi:hypothetical protein
MEKYEISSLSIKEKIMEFKPELTSINKSSQLVLKKDGVEIALNAVPLGIYFTEENSFKWFYDIMKGDQHKHLLKVKALGIKNNMPELSHPHVSFSDDGDYGFAATASEGKFVHKNKSGAVISTLTLDEILAIGLELYEGNAIYGVESLNKDGSKPSKIAYIVIKDDFQELI